MQQSRRCYRCTVQEQPQPGGQQLRIPSSQRSQLDEKATCCKQPQLPQRYGSSAPKHPRYCSLPAQRGRCLQDWWQIPGWNTAQDIESLSTLLQQWFPCYANVAPLWRTSNRSSSKPFGTWELSGVELSQPSTRI